MVAPPLEVDLNIRQVGAGSSVGHGLTGCLGQPVPDPCLPPGRVGSAHALSINVSGRVFFGLGRVFWLWVGFFGLGQVLGQNLRTVPNPLIVEGQKTRPAPTRRVNRVGSGFFGRVGLGGPCSGLTWGPEFKTASWQNFCRNFARIRLSKNFLTRVFS